MCDATEALRLATATYFRMSNSDCDVIVSTEDTSGFDGRDRWWSSAALYLKCLLQTGLLYEVAGLPEDALHALRECTSLVNKLYLNSNHYHRNAVRTL